MTRPSDRVGAMLSEAGLAADDRLCGLLSAIESLGEGPAPRPGPALAALLGPADPAPAQPGPAGPAGPTPRWRRRLVGGAGALAVTVVAATGVAAAANELPPDAQRFAARMSEQLLPFRFPRPPTLRVRGAAAGVPHRSDQGPGPLEPAGGSTEWRTSHRTASARPGVSADPDRHPWRRRGQWHDGDAATRLPDGTRGDRDDRRGEVDGARYAGTGGSDAHRSGGDDSREGADDGSYDGGSSGDGGLDDGSDTRGDGYAGSTSEGGSDDWSRDGSGDRDGPSGGSSYDEAGGEPDGDGR